jgi:2-dehydro-3-deoxygluconokinase
LTGTRFDLTTFGETMLRMSVPVGERLEQARRFEVVPGGTESNVCAALAGLGRQAGWISRLPDGPTGRFIIRGLREAGIDTSAVVTTSRTRVGTYFVEFAAPPSSSDVIYDRENSSVTQLSSEEVDWDYLLDTRILHLTGITPALSGALSELVEEAMHRAHARGIIVSFDVNYRSKLWSPEEAKSRLEALFPLVDILVCGHNDAANVFGLTGEPIDVLSRLSDLTEASNVVLTRSNEGAIAMLNGEILEVPAVTTVTIDRLGAGDGFMAGLIDGFLDNDIEAGLHRGTALAALVLNQHGDMVTATREDLERVMTNAGGGISR